LVETNEAKGKDCGQEKGVALRQIVMPGIAAVEDSEGLRDVKVEEAEGWQCPLLVVNAIDECRKYEYKGPDGSLVRAGRCWEKGPPTRKALLPQLGSFFPLRSQVR